MTKDEVKTILFDELGKIAPEIDPSQANPMNDLREEFDIDSMDFLNLVTALHERLGIDIPETDYSSMFSLDAAVTYLASHA